MKNYNITPTGNMLVLENSKDNIQMITFGMDIKNLKGRLKGIKPNDKAFFTTNIEFRDKVIATVVGLN